MADFDTIPVRLPSGAKAIVQLPRPFTTDDAAHLIHFLSGYSEDKPRPVDPYAGHCAEGDRCVCGGDTPRVRAGCGNWRNWSKEGA